MTRSVLAGLVLVTGLLVSGCGGDASCDDLESITDELANTDVDDPDYNDLVNRAKQAAADCNT